MAARTQARRSTMLVVEDNQKLRDLVTFVLSENGFTVLSAGAVDEALAIVKNHGEPVDLAIIDMTLPSVARAGGGGTSGLDLAVELERLQTGIAILYITGNPYAIAMQAIRQHSPDHVLFKPFSPQQVVERVTNLLGPRENRAHERGGSAS